MKLTCPWGVEHPAESVTSVVSTTEPDLDLAVVFDCGCGRRGFTLKRAIASGIFTDDEIEKLRAEARKLRGESRSDFRSAQAVTILAGEHKGQAGLVWAVDGDKIEVLTLEGDYHVYSPAELEAVATAADETKGPDGGTKGAADETKGPDGGTEDERRHP
ncbi:hypothetical protein LCGC14_2445010 [marine sediment metagenome]|uniref:Uncharacterized protein n=1 Tax=marine sediment metagenome TaxID=412755 RepID=A0A0F9DUY6_9ZZZZ